MYIKRTACRETAVVSDVLYSPFIRRDVYYVNTEQRLLKI